MDSFEDVRSHLSAHYKLSANDPYLISTEITLPESRRQGVYLADLESEDGRRYLRISSPISPMARVNAERCLKFNWEQRVGYLAVSDIGQRAYLHICENRPYSGLDGGEIDHIIHSLAPLADQLEKAFNEGKDQA